MEIVGCGNYTIRAVTEWFSAGGRRLDAADSYDTQYSVGVAMAKAISSRKVARADMFVLQKTGNWNPMGYNVRPPTRSLTVALHVETTP